MNLQLSLLRNNAPSAPLTSPSTQISESSNSYGQITDRVATITDTQYTAELIPLILHFHAVLGPSWPIVFFTTQTLIDEHLVSKSANQKDISASWKKALKDGRIEVRKVPDKFHLTNREGVNVYLADKWMWEQLAPAKNVLVFQTDAVLCANSPSLIDDFLQYDFVGAAMPPPNSMIYNGGLSLRNRTMIMDILNEGKVWKPHPEGEDVWFSKHMHKRGANLPKENVSQNFALQYPWNFKSEGRPLGYHKIQKNVPQQIEGISKWCPEIALTKRGTLAQ